MTTWRGTRASLLSHGTDEVDGLLEEDVTTEDERANESDGTDNGLYDGLYDGSDVAATDDEDEGSPDGVEDEGMEAAKAESPDSRVGASVSSNADSGVTWSA